ncbi:hypothetical protein PORUE0001_0273 [Porphyromonas uenonis 60-3]|uniref:Minor fimbrium subunit Mfa1 C-terminal domain-containing protein n=1 Tax=Porphyromonas uenonis 60-3 TaxID=596327 RepID=C2M9U5_9PORP|nr:Mfa1 family fimbria major subunit [Porphyromonas uenonis]EEK17508.1 hypothetical protein PORUE0001_0273 [Porphyromonas uenonis 60-3]
MNRTVRTLLGLLTIGLVALTSCKKDQKEPHQNEGTTYVNVAISIPTGLRATPGEGDDDEYNPKGKWNGKDAIENITVYVVDKNSVSWDGYTKADFDITPATSTTNITITTKKAILTTPGNKKVYVVINAPQAIKDYLNKAIPNEFEQAYEKAVSVIAAKEATKVDGDGNDVILMTNATAPAEQTIEDGVTAEKAKNGLKNQIKVQVQRAVARVILTTTKPEYEIVRADGVVLGKIKNITYAVAQGENSFYLTQKRLNSSSSRGVVKTLGYNFIPKTDNPGVLPAKGYTDMENFYDYSDLVETAKPGQAREALVADDLNSALAIGEKSLKSSAFIFENTHKYGAYDIFNYKGGYRRANTAYVLVRATFVPNNDAFADKAKFTEPYKEGETFYVGENGALYRSAINVTDEKSSGAGGVEGQKYSEYKNGKVLYYAIVNPDKTERPLNAPVYRNSIYHISVTGFKKIGVNWNPLFPEDPDSDNPKNPDPKPKDNPNEPVPPIKPEDNLSPKETYMAVDVTVVPWSVHTYNIELTIP